MMKSRDKFRSSLFGCLAAREIFGPNFVHALESGSQFSISEATRLGPDLGDVSNESESYPTRANRIKRLLKS